MPIPALDGGEMRLGFRSICMCLAWLAGDLSPALANDANSLPTFRTDISTLISTALRESLSDFDHVPSEPVENRRMRSVKPFGASLQECWVGQSSMNGMPRLLFCMSKPFANGELAERKRDIAAAIETQGMKSWSKKTEPRSIIWALNNDYLEVDIGDLDPKTKSRVLFVGFRAPTHIERSALGPAIERLLQSGIPAADGKFASIPASHTDGIFDEVDTYFGDALPSCRKYMGTLECFSPDFVESADTVTEAARSAIATALPAGFAADACGRNVANWPVCHWNGPKGVQISLIVQSSVNGKELNSVRLSINAPSN